MKLSPTYRAILGAFGLLALGWVFGYLMGGAADAPSLEQTSMSPTSLGATARASRGTVEAFTLGEGDAGFISATSSFAGTPGAIADFESRMRGALRLTDNIDRMTRLREVARSITVADLPTAIEKAKRLPNSERWEVLQALGSRWAESDPVGAAEFAVKEGSLRYGWNQLLHGVIDKWSALDQDAAVAWMNRQPEGRRMNLTYALIQSVARRDPQSALQILQAQPQNYQSTWLHDQVFEQWSKRDPSGAAKAAEAMALGSGRERALQAVAASWASQDPREAIRWAESFPDKHNQNRLLRSVAQSWAENEPNAVIQWAGGLSEPQMRQQILSAAYSKLVQTDAEGAREKLRALPAGQERDNLVTQVTQAAAQEDAKAAMKLVELLPPGTSRNNTTAFLAVRIATTDPKTAAEIFATIPEDQMGYQVGQFATTVATANMQMAREWVDSLKSPQARTQALRSVAGVLARGEPKAAAEWLLERDPSADLGWLLNNWVRSAPSDVLSWSKNLPDGDAKRSAQAAVVGNIAQADLAKAREIFARDLSSEARVSSAGQLASLWATRDVSAARSWAEKLPDGGARDNALAAVARTWAQQDSNAAAQWLQQMPNGDGRDRAVTQFASAIGQKDPAAALDWAATIADPNLRASQLEQLAGRWLQNNSSAAREWINTTDHLTPSARKRIFEQRAPVYNYNQFYDYD